MKKILFTFVILGITIFSSCAGNPDEVSEKSRNTKTVVYGTIEADWYVYPDSQSLVDKADLIFTGKIMNISFQMLDLTTAYPPTEKTEDINNVLHTIYDVDIIAMYKGVESKTVQVSIMGGLRDYNVEEQLVQLSKKNEKTIPVMDGIPKMTIGDKYLFVVGKNGDRPSFVLNPDQSLLNLDNPFEKHYNVTVNDIIATCKKI